MKPSVNFLAFIFAICSLTQGTLAAHDGPGGPKSIGNSAAPGIGGSGPYDASNVSLLGRLSLDQMGAGQGNVLGNDCWGWTDPKSGKEYAIAGLTNGTSFIDITDPTDPKYLGKLLTHTGNSSWRDMKVFNNHVFVVSDNNDAHGMQVFDLTQLRNADPESPSNFSNTAHYDGCGSAHNIAINEDSGHAYILGSNRAFGGLHVVDINNPLNPTEAGNFGASDSDYTHDAQIVNYIGPDGDYAGREIAFAANEDTLTIVDVTNKSQMTLIGNYGYPQDFYTHQCWLSEDQRYIYLCDELDEHPNYGNLGPPRTHVWDLLDLDAPVYKGFYSGPTTAIDHNLYVKDGLVYLASYSAGLRVMEINSSDPSQLTEIAYFDTYTTDTDTDFDGVWSCYPYYESGTIFVNDRQNGAFFLRLNSIELGFPNGLPELIDPDGATTLDVAVSAVFGEQQPNSGVLHVDRGNGWEEFSMQQVNSSLYRGTFPETTCGEEFSYFVSVLDTDGNLVTYPSTAPTVTCKVLSADGVDSMFTDDFESDLGWTFSGDAETGQWERGVSAGDGTRGDPIQDADGSGSCILTGNGAGDTDVDGGATVLTSPTMTALGGSNGIASVVSYNRWFSNDVGNAPADDVFLVEISNDDGETWVTLETVGPGGNEVSGGWIFKRFDIGDFVTPTNQMKLRFTASDLGEGSIVEAGVDGVKIDVVNCDAATAILGDANNDGVLNNSDISSFVLALTNPVAYQALFSNVDVDTVLDMNQDGVFDNQDITGFVAALTGP